MERAEELARTLVSCARPLRNEVRARGQASSTEEGARVRGSSMASIPEQFAKIGTDHGINRLHCQMKSIDPEYSMGDTVFLRVHLRTSTIRIGEVCRE